MSKDKLKRLAKTLISLGVLSLSVIEGCQLQCRSGIVQNYQDCFLMIHATAIKHTENFLGMN